MAWCGLFAADCSRPVIPEFARPLVRAGAPVSRRARQEHDGADRVEAERRQSARALFDMISEVMVDRILPAGGPDGAAWQPWLARLAWAMHDVFLAVPGYATRVARPHRHNLESFGRLRASVVAAFTAAGVEVQLAEQSWYTFGSSLVSWLAAAEAPLDLGTSPPRFELFLDSLLRGLPAREPGITRPEPDALPSP
jgi:hypothetical protein